MSMSDSERPPAPVPQRAATVADLQQTPITLGVVIAIQALALLVAGVIWGRVSSIDSKVDSLGDKMDARFDAMQRDTASRFESLQRDTANRFEAMQRDNGSRFDAMHRDHAVMREQLGEIKALLQSRRP